MRINGLRSLASVLNKDKNSAAIGALNKMNWSEYHKAVMELYLDVEGMNGQLLTGSDERPVGCRCRSSRWHARVIRCRRCRPAFFFSRSETIWGGTAEIQRNIVGERVLGLPKEPKPAKVTEG